MLSNNYPELFKNDRSNFKQIKTNFKPTWKLHDVSLWKNVSNHMLDHSDSYSNAVDITCSDTNANTEIVFGKYSNSTEEISLRVVWFSNVLDVLKLVNFDLWCIIKNSEYDISEIMLKRFRLCTIWNCKRWSRNEASL